MPRRTARRDLNHIRLVLKAKQRKEIEKKIEVKEQEEKNKIKEERSELYRERRKQQIRIRSIEQKLQMVGEVSLVNSKIFLSAKF